MRVAPVPGDRARDFPSPETVATPPLTVHYFLALADRLCEHGLRLHAVPVLAATLLVGSLSLP